jgi:carboxypeptidase PM20D1
LDNKDAVLGTLEAVEWLLGEGFQPQRTVYLAFGHDEEIGGRMGAAQITEFLSDQGVQLDYVLDEGLAVTEGILASIQHPVALVGIAEKGYTSLELTVESEGGHSSMPPAHTAVGVLSTAIHKLERAPMPARLPGPTRQMFRFLAPEMPFVMRAAFANLWLAEPLVKRMLAAKPATNAMVRTTTAATMFEAGIKDNVLPDRARAVVNFRILMGDDFDGIIDHVRRAIGDERVAVRPLFEFGSEPSRVSDTDSISFRALHQTICQVFPGVLVAPGLVLGATDSRHYAGLTDNIYRFSPIRVGPGDLDRIHGTDERISVDDYGRAVRFYVQLIRNTSAA